MSGLKETRFFLWDLMEELALKVWTAFYTMDAGRRIAPRQGCGMARVACIYYIRPSCGADGTCIAGRLTRHPVSNGMCGQPSLTG